MNLSHLRRTVLGVVQGFGLFREGQFVPQGTENAAWLLVQFADIVRGAAAQGGIDGLRSRGQRWRARRGFGLMLSAIHAIVGCCGGL